MVFCCIGYNSGTSDTVTQFNYLCDSGGDGGDDSDTCNKNDDDNDNKGEKMTMMKTMCEKNIVDSNNDKIQTRNNNASKQQRRLCELTASHRSIASAASSSGTFLPLLQLSHSAILPAAK